MEHPCPVFTAKVMMVQVGTTPTTTTHKARGFPQGSWVFRLPGRQRWGGEGGGALVGKTHSVGAGEIE